MSERIKRNLTAAIATMRAACDDAERRSEIGDARSIEQVLHSLTWGFANAGSSIQTAMSASLDEHEIAMFGVKDQT